jgi:hypothetical protein
LQILGEREVAYISLQPEDNAGASALSRQTTRAGHGRWVKLHPTH